MPSAATIDFWHTLVDDTNGTERNAARRKALMAAIEAECGGCDADEFEQAYTGLWEYFDQHWLGSRRTPTSDEMVRQLLVRLERTLREETIAEVVREFEEGILDNPPSVLPGVPEGLEYLRERGIRLAIISDTAFSPGSVLKRLLEKEGLAPFFDAFIFSNETGVAKPHPEAFRLALDALGADASQGFHIGDIERTDILGAKEAGMKAVLYKGARKSHKYAEETTSADAVMERWDELPRVLEELEREANTSDPWTSGSATVE